VIALALARSRCIPPPFPRWNYLKMVVVDVTDMTGTASGCCRRCNRVASTNRGVSRSFRESDRVWTASRNYRGKLSTGGGGGERRPDVPALDFWRDRMPSRDLGIPRSSKSRCRFLRHLRPFPSAAVRPPSPEPVTPAAGKRAFNVRVVFEPKSVWG